MEKYFKFFLVIAESFLKQSQNAYKKNQLSPKKITSGTAFFAPIWHKTWLSGGTFFFNLFTASNKGIYFPGKVIVIFDHFWAKIK